MPLNASSEINGERDQYIAVSTFREEHQFRSSMISSFASNYLIQIWNCGKLPTSEPTTTVPKLELCIAHEFGRVWSLKWCPSGCYDAERLGILAAACSDGTVRCFSVPHPSSVGDNLRWYYCLVSNVSVLSSVSCIVNRYSWNPSPVQL